MTPTKRFRCIAETRRARTSERGPALHVDNGMASGAEMGPIVTAAAKVHIEGCIGQRGTEGPQSVLPTSN